MKYMILGAGQAGFTTAKTIRGNDPAAQIRIFDADPAGLYAKMRLPEFVAGTLPEAKLILAGEAAFRAMDIEPFLGVEVTSVRRAEHKVTTADGREFDYDKLVFATGATAFVPPVQGLDRVESFTLRTLSDARRIAAKCSGPGPEALVIGGGLLGLEAAWALRQRGAAVTVAEFMDRLLPRQLNEAESAVLLRKLGDFELNFKLGVSLQSVSPADGGRIRAVFSDGSEAVCSLLLFSAGIRSRVELAAAAGLEIGRAIKVDHQLRTSDPDIYAAGDCAELDGVTPGLWLAAGDQGAALGRILTGKQDRFDSPAYTPILKIGGVSLKEICREAAGK
ncbi:MAG: NAD(P)/FAD-dependent oxidoreductase [Lentisphaeria bacterium]|nr:NAD(P)/FAD-dependent oxidoreductase [Lentisphaeria bacterium]